MSRTTRTVHHWLIALASIAASLIAVAASAQTIPNGGLAQANRELSVYQTVNGGYPATGMPLVKRLMTDANGYVHATGLPAANNIVADLNGAKNATITLATITALPHAVRALPAGGDFEGRAIKYPSGDYKLLSCDRNNANAVMAYICKPKMIVEPLRSTGLPSTQ
jgi:hypothetical protein